MGMVNYSLQSVHECLLLTTLHLNDKKRLNGDLQTVRALINETNVCYK
jgi:hypothetical protein